MKKAVLITTIASFVSGAAFAADMKICVEGAYPPFSVTESDGTLSGFDVDISNALCADMGKECELVKTDWDGIIPSLLEKKCDAIIASMSITEERKQVIDFTEKYYATPAKFVAKADAGLDDTPEALSGKVVGVQRGTVSHDFLEGEYSDLELKLYATQEEALLDLEAGRVDAVFADSVTLLDGFLNTDAGKGYAFFGKAHSDVKYFGEGIGIGVRKEDTELRDALSASIHSIRDGGKYDEIAKNYFDFDIYGADGS